MLPNLKHSGPYAIDGPYLRWLRALRERLGDDVLEMMALWPANRVDKFIDALFVPFEGSRYAADEAEAKKERKTTVRFDPESVRQWHLQRTTRDPVVYQRRTGSGKRIIG